MLPVLSFRMWKLFDLVTSDKLVSRSIQTRLKVFAKSEPIQGINVDLSRCSDNLEYVENPFDEYVTGTLSL